MPIQDGAHKLEPKQLNRLGSDRESPPTKKSRGNLHLVTEGEEKILDDHFTQQVNQEDLESGDYDLILGDALEYIDKQHPVKVSQEQEPARLRENFRKRVKIAKEKAINLQQEILRLNPKQIRSLRSLLDQVNKHLTAFSRLKAQGKYGPKEEVFLKQLDKTTDDLRDEFNKKLAKIAPRAADEVVPVEDSMIIEERSDDLSSFNGVPSPNEVQMIDDDLIEVNIDSNGITKDQSLSSGHAASESDGGTAVGGGGEGGGNGGDDGGPYDTVVIPETGERVTIQEIGENIDGLEKRLEALNNNGNIKPYEYDSLKEDLVGSRIEWSGQDGTAAQLRKTGKIDVTIPTVRRFRETIKEVQTMIEALEDGESKNLRNIKKQISQKFAEFNDLGHQLASIIKGLKAFKVIPSSEQGKFNLTNSDYENEQDNYLTQKVSPAWHLVKLKEAHNEFSKLKQKLLGRLMQNLNDEIMYSTALKNDFDSALNSRKITVERHQELSGQVKRLDKLFSLTMKSIHENNYVFFEQYLDQYSELKTELNKVIDQLEKISVQQPEADQPEVQQLEKEKQDQREKMTKIQEEFRKNWERLLQLKQASSFFVKNDEAKYLDEERKKFLDPNTVYNRKKKALKMVIKYREKAEKRLKEQTDMAAKREQKEATRAVNSGSGALENLEPTVIVDKSMFSGSSVRNSTSAMVRYQPQETYIFSIPEGQGLKRILGEKLRVYQKELAESLAHQNSDQSLQLLKKIIGSAMVRMNKEELDKDSQLSPQQLINIPPIVADKMNDYLMGTLRREIGKVKISWLNRISPFLRARDTYLASPKLKPDKVAQIISRQIAAALNPNEAQRQIEELDSQAPEPRKSKIKTWWDRRKKAIAAGGLAGLLSFGAGVGIHETLKDENTTDGTDRVAQLTRDSAHKLSQAEKQKIAAALKQQSKTTRPSSPDKTPSVKGGGATASTKEEGISDQAAHANQMTDSEADKARVGSPKKGDHDKIGQPESVSSVDVTIHHHPVQKGDTFLGVINRWLSQDKNLADKILDSLAKAAPNNSRINKWFSRTKNWSQVERDKYLLTKWKLLQIENNGGNVRSRVLKSPVIHINQSIDLDKNSDGMYTLELFDDDNPGNEY